MEKGQGLHTQTDRKVVIWFAKSYRTKGEGGLDGGKQQMLRSKHKSVVLLEWRAHSQKWVSKLCLHGMKTVTLQENLHAKLCWKGWFIRKVPSPSLDTTLCVTAYTLPLPPFSSPPANTSLQLHRLPRALRDVRTDLDDSSRTHLQVPPSPALPRLPGVDRPTDLHLLVASVELLVG